MQVSLSHWHARANAPYQQQRSVFSRGRFFCEADFSTSRVSVLAIGEHGLLL
jgi:hypothetical protein